MRYIPEPFPLHRRDGVRRVYVSGHQCGYAAYWHGWTVRDDGEMVAVLEMHSGEVCLERFLPGLTFIDR